MMNNKLNHLTNLIDFNNGQGSQVICFNYKDLQEKLDLVNKQIEELYALKYNLELHLDLLKEIN